MEISLLCTSNKPLKAFFSKVKAEREYNRLKKLDVYFPEIDYSIITMSTEDQPPNTNARIANELPIKDIK